MHETSTLRGAGGTSGGIGTFLGGLVLTVVGGWLFASRVIVTTGFWSLYGVNAFGLSLVPLLVGIFLLFFDGRSPLGWLLTLGGGAIMVAGIIVNLQVYFQPTTLPHTLLMLGMLVGGLGMITRSLRPS